MNVASSDNQQSTSLNPACHDRLVQKVKAKDMIDQVLAHTADRNSKAAVRIVECCSHVIGAINIEILSSKIAQRYTISSLLEVKGQAAFHAIEVEIRRILEDAGWKVVEAVVEPLTGLGPRFRGTIEWPSEMTELVNNEVRKALYP
ncbi:hypothetical protein HDU89_000373 [Geranomyces variabilis]|nr:hypothetical protein HDU89_000373 [Geranomyces variabilis]